MATRCAPCRPYLQSCLTPLIHASFGFFRESRIENPKLCVLCVFAVQISGYQHWHIEFTKGLAQGAFKIVKSTIIKYT